MSQQASAHLPAASSANANQAVEDGGTSNEKTAWKRMKKPPMPTSVLPTRTNGGPMHRNGLRPAAEGGRMPVCGVAPSDGGAACRPSQAEMECRAAVVEA